METSELRNNYAFSRNNPISWLDATGKYGEDFHRSLVFLLALMEGMPLSDAEKLSAASNLPDIDTEMWSYNPKGKVTYHFAEADEADKRIEAACKSGDVVQFGIALHVVADSKYAHYKHIGDPLGHGPENVTREKGNRPDEISADPKKARAAMREIRFWIGLFISLHFIQLFSAKRHCQPLGSSILKLPKLIYERYRS